MPSWRDVRSTERWPVVLSLVSMQSRAGAAGRVMLSAREASTLASQASSRSASSRGRLAKGE
jgi:hypothetical protein